MRYRESENLASEDKQSRRETAKCAFRLSPMPCCGFDRPGAGVLMRHLSPQWLAKRLHVLPWGPRQPDRSSAPESIRLSGFGLTDSRRAQRARHRQQPPGLRLRTMPSEANRTSVGRSPVRREPRHGRGEFHWRSEFGRGLLRPRMQQPVLPRRWPQRPWQHGELHRNDQRLRCLSRHASRKRRTSPRCP
jgi:hypothetical protein